MKTLSLTLNPRICPFCKGSNTKRIRRAPLDKRFPMSKRYSCSRCGTEYIHFLKSISLIKKY